MCSYETVSLLDEVDEEILNHQVEVELSEYGIWNRLSDSEYEQGIAQLTKQEVARVIEFNRQTQEVEPSSLSR